MNTDSCVSDAVAEIVSMAHDRKAVLIFCAGVAHAESVMKELRQYSNSVAGVFGDTLPFLREETLADFKAGKLKYLVNVGVLTTGFDAPITDCVVLLRPTNSPGLYYQMVGRGFRLHPEKENCLVLDFAGNIERHGPVDMIEVSPIDNPSKEKRGKTCPECREVVATSAVICPACDHHFVSEPKPPPELDQRHPRKTLFRANLPTKRLKSRVSATAFTSNAMRRRALRAPCGLNTPTACRRFPNGSARNIRDMPAGNSLLGGGNSRRVVNFPAMQKMQFGSPMKVRWKCPKASPSAS